MHPSSTSSAASTETHSLQQALEHLRELASGLQELALRAEQCISLLETRPPVGWARANGDPPGEALSLVDASTFTVNWDGKTCHLGYTVPFRLIAHLASNEGRYVPLQELLDEVWGGPRTASAVRSAFASLRKQLVDAGMGPLATAIRGHNSGHYGFVRPPAAPPSTSD